MVLQAVSNFLRKRAMEKFWVWFAENMQNLTDAPTGQENVFLEFSSRFYKIVPSLEFQIGGDRGIRELIISAGGVAENIPLLEEFVSLAPSVPGWKIIKYRQRQSDITEATINGLTLRLQDIRVMIKPADPWRPIDIVVLINNEKSANDLILHAFLLLDCVLGEYNVMTQLGHIDFMPLQNPREGQPLEELVAMIDARRKR